jgi:2-C-methyl-D-erythritol 4-phosphate cytidylyltransferase
VSVWAVIVAAGRGERFGADRPKAFVRLGELPLLAEPLRRLDDTPWIDAIVVVAPRDWEEPTILLAEEIGADKVREVVTGGETRTDSVRAGVEAVAGDAVALLVHDAARPLVPDDVVERVLAPLGEGWDGVVPSLALPDTVKRVRDGGVVETVARDDLVAVQTPQAFPADTLRSALRPSDAVSHATDCAALVEAAGGRVKIVAGDRKLLKVTTPEDLALVEAWL